MTQMLWELAQFEKQGELPMGYHSPLVLGSIRVRDNLFFSQFSLEKPQLMI